MGTLGSCDCNEEPTYQGGNPLTPVEIAHQLHLDIERLRELIEDISNYGPPGCAKEANKTLVNTIQKAMRLEQLIKNQPPTDRVVIDNGKKTAVCYRKQLACGQPILYCWIDGSTDSFIGKSIEEIKEHPLFK